MSVNIDDTDPAIQYSGSWQVLMNSPLEYGGGVHSTTQTGASATITFVGTRIQLFCTVPMNSGTETADFTFDGHTGPPLSRESHPDTTYYKDGWFDSGPLDNTVHVLTVSNGGGSSDAPLQLDYFSIAGSVVSPTPAVNQSPQQSPSPTQGEKTTTVTAAEKTSPTATNTSTHSASGSSSSTAATSSTSSSASGRSSSAATIPLVQSAHSATDTSTSSAITAGPTVTSVQYVTTAADGSVSTAATNASEGALGSPSSRASVGPIVGGVLGGLAVILLVLLLLLWRRRKARRLLLGDDAESRLDPRNPTAPIPFPLESDNSSASDLITRPREMEQTTTKLSPSRYIASPTSPLGSEVPAMSTISNNASSSDEKGLSYVTSPSVDHPPSVSPFLDPNLLPEEDAGPFRPPPSYQSVRGSRQ
ncbi:hypothetical protein CVT26_010564 [Gymnopilus dilepis]|uniref:Mid2 domain-containing protein n=1 Tax=Gymnopilus dilepis TaxID=231916 RepID=A0A409W4X7_9AGAR|nr:hypothetical protein CVT26_010564 [Gymnopilus dilepis]